MDSVKVKTEKTLTLVLPSDPEGNTVTATVTHDLGEDVIVEDDCTRVSAGNYSFTLGEQPNGEHYLASSGVHKVKFTYEFSGETYSQYQYINAYVPYTDADNFFDDYPEYIDKFGNSFDKYELRVRNIINTYCGQSFDFFPSKSIFVDGNNHKILHLPLPISTLTKVTQNFGEESQEVLHDATNSSLLKIEKVRQPGNFETSYYLRYKSTSTEFTSSFSETPAPNTARFSPRSVYKVEGDFGWRYVPTNVQQAANLLIADLMNDDSEFRRHGITSVSMDTTTFSLKSNFYESTGNIDADVLLMDYMLFVMDYVV